MRTPLSAALLLITLSACGTKPIPAAAGDGNSTAIAVTPDEEPAVPGQPAGITAIDAATGDAQAMPADSTAPSAYDLAQRAARTKDNEAKRDAPAAAAEPVLPSAPASLLGGDESVSTGD